MIDVIRWGEDHVALIDQRVLPAREEYFPCRNVGEVAGERCTGVAAAATGRVANGASAANVDLRDAVADPGTASSADRLVTANAAGSLSASSPT